ncbi:MAG TPA: hypothetical protein VG106_07815, partial [Vicinamibacterales bacterium]|nr:hypothetical protein [Vicinamibacterales bacterium]
TSGPIGADAAQVTVGRTTSYLLARFFSPGGVRVTARATAWGGAPAMKVSCISPFFILHHDYMEAFGKRHEDMLTHEDVRTLRDTSTNKRWLTVKLKRSGSSNSRPEPGIFYGMELPTPYSGETPRRGEAEYRKNVTDCNTMERGWVARTEEFNTTKGQTLPGFEQLCKPLAAGVCYNANGGIGVPINVSIFCTGPEHTGGTMWFQVEWMTGFMVTGVEQTSSELKLTGYLVPVEGTGEIRADGEATGIVRTILVR